MKTYVSVYEGGFGDDHYQGILYAGQDFSLAEQALIDFTFPDDYNNYGYIQVWIDGKIVETKYVRS